MVREENTSTIGLTRTKPKSKVYQEPIPQRSREIHKPWENWTPKRRSIVTRMLKIGAYYVFGYLLAVAAFFVVYKLTSDAVDPLLVQITGFIVASITGGIHKAINWQAAGIDPSTIPEPSPDASLPASVTLPTIPTPTDTKEG